MSQHLSCINIHALSIVLIFCCIVDGKFNSNELSVFSKWKLSDSTLKELPIDQETRNFVRTVKNVIFSEVLPTPLKINHTLVLISRNSLEKCLEINYDNAMTNHLFRDFSCGNLVLNTSFSHRYGGHQFGSWASQLGDGRAHLLGEYVNKAGQRWELQLKGSGRTPYSRRGDGRAVLRSSLREFLCSEAMHYLGVPTSRAVSLVVSDDPVIRDPLYNGTIVTEKAAVVLRLAPSWFRFGSFEILAENNELELMSQLLDFVINHHFKDAIASESTNRYLEFYRTVFHQTIDMVVKWMSVGFAHGVCNTDNFSILSITIDYGPFGFVDAYDPNFVPNLSDDTGMYALERQPSVALFNLRKLYDALKLVLTSHARRDCEKLLLSFGEIYHDRLVRVFKSKLGLYGDDDDDQMLIASLLHVMKETKADFTMTFRELSSLPIGDVLKSRVPRHMWALGDLKKHKFFDSWLKAYGERVKKYPLDDDTRLGGMRKVNPRYVLRTWMAEGAIKRAEKNDFSEAWKIHMTLQRPFEEQPTAELSGFASRPPTWAKKLRVTCSS